MRWRKASGETSPRGSAIWPRRGQAAPRRLGRWAKARGETSPRRSANGPRRVARNRTPQTRRARRKQKSPLLCGAPRGYPGPRGQDKWRPAPRHRKRSPRHHRLAQRRRTRVLRPRRPVPRHHQIADNASLTSPLRTMEPSRRSGAVPSPTSPVSAGPGLHRRCAAAARCACCSLAPPRRTRDRTEPLAVMSAYCISLSESSPSHRRQTLPSPLQG